MNRQFISILLIIRKSELSVDRLYLVRHGETEWNRLHIWQGHYGPGLNEAGRKQIEITAEKLENKGITSIIASDVKRAVESCDIISSKLHLHPEFYEDFRERDLGDFSGKDESEVLKMNPGLKLQNGFQGPIDLPSVEKWKDFVKRITLAIDRVIRLYSGNVVIVTHGGVIFVALRYFDSKVNAPVVPNGNVSSISIRQGGLIEEIYL